MLAEVFAQMLTLCKVCLFALGLDSFMSKGAEGSLPTVSGLDTTLESQGSLPLEASPLCS